MLVSRHRIGKYLPEVVHQDADPAALSVCREVLAETGAECVVLHGSRAWGGWDEQSNLDLIVIHGAADDQPKPDNLLGKVGPIKDRNYQNDPDLRITLKQGQEVVTPEYYAARRRTLNHAMARAARGGIIFPRETGTEECYRHDGDTSNEWDLVTKERLRMAAIWDRSITVVRGTPGEMVEGSRRRYSRLNVRTSEGCIAHTVLWHSGAALLSILGAICPMRSVVEIARLIRERDDGWKHRFRSDLERIDHYSECGCEVVVTDPIWDLPEMWKRLEVDRDAMWQRILQLSGYDPTMAGPFP